MQVLYFPSSSQFSRNVGHPSSIIGCIYHVIGYTLTLKYSWHFTIIWLNSRQHLGNTCTYIHNLLELHTNKESSQEDLNCLCLDYASKEACGLFLVLFWNSVTFLTFHCKPVAVRGWKWGYIIMHEADLAIKSNVVQIVIFL